MAAPHMTFGYSLDEPLRPADVNWRGLRDLWDASEQSVFESAFAPGADAERPLGEPRSAAFQRSEERSIADAAWED